MVKFRIVFVCLFLCIFISSTFCQSRIEKDLSGKGWRLWYDKEAKWQNDTLYLALADISKIKAQPPTGGWETLERDTVKDVSVPGTLEEYFQKIPGPEGDLTGVSWWFRNLQIPYAKGPRKILLRFDAVRYRSEVFINQRLVGYDLVGNTPFEVDISNFVKNGESVRLAVRVTDPGGNFDWKDWMTIDWGSYKVPGSHGFGGITGNVKLISCNTTYISDIYVQNTPAITRITPQVTIVNSSGKNQNRSLLIRITDKTNTDSVIYSTVIKNNILKPGDNHISVSVSLPEAKIWDLDNPNLYNFQVSIMDKGKELDKDQCFFGFRWFDAEDIGSNAVFRLNGKRIVLRSAIDWGFWPVNGIFPTDEMADKQIRVAKSMGLNMLSFHRCIGHPNLLNKADELGLLYYEEPGNYRSSESPENLFAHSLMKEKVKRMVKRDRNHPSLIIYCLINEETDPVPQSVLDLQTRDMREIHQIDPTRLLIRNSGLWPTANDVEEPQKYHMRPYDTTIYQNGWYDNHRAGGPSWWSQSLYRNSEEYYAKTDNLKEITFWGEEGATSTPPRLDLIKLSIDSIDDKGWDGGVYLDWYKRFENFLDTKKLRSSFPTIDALTTCMGSISLETHGKKIETARAKNIVDGFSINGWEAQIIDNPSGIVDCFRNPKAYPGILAYYNQPLYIAIKLKNQILRTNDFAVADFYIINEKNLKGKYILKIGLKNPDKNPVFEKVINVVIQGGDTYGQLIAESIQIPVSDQGGMYKLEISLIDSVGEARAFGKEEILAVDLKGNEIKGEGSVWEYNDKVKKVLKKEQNKDIPNYSENLKKQDWIVVTRSPKGSDFSLVPAGQLTDKNKMQGVTATYYKGQIFNDTIAQVKDQNINLSVAVGDTPDPEVKASEDYSVVWEGYITPVISGAYEFQIQANNISRLTINNQDIITMTRGGTGQGKLNLDSGKAVSFRLEFYHLKGVSNCKLLWSTPEIDPVDPQGIFERVKRDGTTLIILDYVNLWMDFITKNTSVRYNGSFIVGPSWRGGVHFVKDHPLFKDLPVNDGMGWPYQNVISKPRERLGILMEGEETVAGAYHACPMNLGTAVGIIPCGKGRIIFSTLDICSNLLSTDGPSLVSKKLLLNFIENNKTK